MKYLIPIFILVCLGFPLIANAQGFGLCHVFTGYDLTEVGPFGQKLIEILEIITTLLTLVGIGLAVIIIIVSGIRYMGASGDETKVAQARKTLTYGVIGFIIVVAAMFIICFTAEILANLYAI